MLDLELGYFESEFTAHEAIDHLALHRDEPCGGGVSECANRDYREPGIELDRGNRIASRSADERLFEPRVSNRLVGADKAGTELHPCSPHFEIGEHCLAAPDPAGYEHGDIEKVWQDLL